jgi:uncharacterized protein YjbI with pentapeptide repeats
MDTILLELGLSPELFIILTYEEAKEKYYESKPYDFSLKDIDTIILSKVDTFYNRVSIFEKVIPYKFDMSEKVFMNDLDLNSSTFQEEVYFSDSKFNNHIFANKTIFNSSLIFHNVKFKKGASFCGTKFNFLQISECSFEDQVNTSNAEFCGEAHIIGTKFLNILWCNRSTFSDLTRFSGSEFYLRPIFWDTQFKDSLYFNSVSLLEGADFQSTKFKYYLSFSNLISKGKIYFNNTILPEFIDLSNLQTNQIIDFNFIKDSIIDDKYNVNIYNTDPNNLIITNRFSIWFDKLLNLDQRNSIYKQLLANLDQVGYKRVYKSIDLEYRRFINENYNNLFEKISFTLNRLWWNYGYSKERIFLISLIFILIFSIPIFFKFDYFVNEIYKIDNLSKRYEQNLFLKNRITRLSLNYLTALLYTIFIFFNIKLSLDKLSFKNYKSGLLILLIYTFGLLCTAFIINLIVTI